MQRTGEEIFIVLPFKFSLNGLYVYRKEEALDLLAYYHDRNTLGRLLNLGVIHEVEIIWPYQQSVPHTVKGKNWSIIQVSLLKLEVIE